MKKRADEREAIGKVDNTDQEEKPLSAERHSGVFIWNGYRRGKDRTVEHFAERQLLLNIVQD